MVSSLLTPSVLLLDLKFQTIEVTIMSHLYVPISHFKVGHIMYVVFPADKYPIIEMIQDHQLLPSLKIN